MAGWWAARMNGPRVTAVRAWCVARLISPWLPLTLAALALVLTLPALSVGFQVDDHFHRVMLKGDAEATAVRQHPLDLFAPIEGDPEQTRHMVERGVLPWWTPAQLKLAFWRPLAAATHWLDYQLWPNTPALMHLHSMLWYAAAVACAALVYRGIIGATWIAGLAALFYACDDAHGFVVGWIANRNALMAAALGFLAIYMHDRWRRGGWRPGAVLGPAVLLVALFAGEAALGAGAYLLAYALWLDPGKARARALAFVPYAAVTLAWWLSYHWLGYGSFGSELYVDPAQQPREFLLAVARHMPMLLLGQSGVLPAELSYFMSTRTEWVAAAVVTGFGLIVATVAWPLLRTSARARFWATGMLLALLPVCSTVPADRLLMLAGLGFMGLAAEFVGYWFEGVEQRPKSRAWRIAALVVVVATVLLNGVAGPVLLPLRSVTVRLVGAEIDRLNDSLPDDGRLAERDVIIVNTPNAFHSMLLGPTRASRGMELPRHVHMLAVGTEVLDVSRVDERTLSIRSATGLLPLPGVASPGCPYVDRESNHGHAHRRLSGLFRSRALPMTVGEKITTQGMSVEVTEVADDGRPVAAEFRFDVVLEDESLMWLRVEEGLYVPFVPPGVGEGIHLAPARIGGR